MGQEGLGAGSGPLPPFCGRLKRLQKASGLSQTALAGRAGLGKSQMSAILNGGIKQVPDWNLVQQVVHSCLEHAARTGRQVPPDLCNERDWQRRYGDLEQDTEATERPRRRRGIPLGKPVDRWDPFTLGVHHPIAGPQRSSPGPPDLPASCPPTCRVNMTSFCANSWIPWRPNPGMVVLVVDLVLARPAPLTRPSSAVCRAGGWCVRRREPILLTCSPIRWWTRTRCSG